MSKKRTTMNKVREILRLKFDCQLSLRNIGTCLKVGRSTVSEILSRFKLSELGWPLPDGISDQELSKALYHTKAPSSDKVMPDFAKCTQELKRKGMTKRLLWEEYHSEFQQQAYGYTQFCEHYIRWQKSQKRSMRQIHIAGEKLFIDYCGPTVPVVNPDTGEVRDAQIFVATFGASNYTYVEASPSQKQEHWLQAHVNAFEHFGGVPHLLVPDNLKSAVIKPCRYEPKLNESYHKLANHYGTAVIPTRPYKPKDKAKVENAVLVVERWVLMRIRHQTFHTFAELNLTIKDLMKDLNLRVMRQVGATRLELFEKLDKPALKPLPSQPYYHVETKRAKVSPDYHIQYQRHYYSVPHRLVGQHVELEASSKIVRIYHQNVLVAQHPASSVIGKKSTIDEHMPEAHQYQNYKWTPERIMSWGRAIGTSTENVVQQLMLKQKHPAQAFNSCLGILNLSRRYGDARLEQACQDALMAEKPYFGFIKNLLEHNREGKLSSESTTTPNIQHRNVRGPNSYH